LAGQITSGMRSPGSRLPTEEQLAAEHGVSRSVVREAIARLKSEGLVVTRQGFGASVSPSPPAPPFRIPAESLDSDRAVIEVFELRLAVEAEAAALAAERATAAQRRDIAAALRALDRVDAAAGDGVEEDLAFHRAIVRGANNRRYDDLVAFLGQHIRSQMAISRGTSRDAHRLNLLRPEHAAIHAAIRARDPEAARAAARAHFRNGIERLRRPGSH
jgi:DNA-binding FadR family transcriptional regulator